MRPPHEIVLRALSCGQEVTMPNGLVIKYMESEKNGMEFFSKYYNDWLHEEIDLAQFIKDCKQFKQDDLFILAAQTALNEEKRYVRKG